jgi:hypothetical protein
MAQSNSGTVAVTSGSAAIVGTSTTWLTDSVSAGDGFTIVDSGVTYDIATVTDDTHATLSANYAGTTASGLSYTIFTDFTTDNIPELNKGDIETATIWTRAVRKIQDLITQIKNLAGGTVTHNFTSDGDYTLTSTQEGYGRLVLTDTTPVLSTSRNVIVSTTARGRWYKNSTAQTLTIKTSAGTGIDIASTASAYLVCDGTNVAEGYNLLGYGVTATAAELNYVDVTTQGVAQASRAVVLDANKTFAGITELWLQDTSPILHYTETDASADNKIWAYSANSEAFYGQVINDAYSVAGTWLIINRTGITIDSVDLLGTAVTINGNTAWHAGNDGTNTGLAADIGATASIPASAVATGTAGQISYDSSYVYICTATNTWKRAAIAAW